MIETLNIKNIGIIEDITISFKDGFNVLTGETGTGKSLIIDALNLIAGGRFSKDMIRTGENHCLVEACIYDCNSKEAVDGGNIIISREIFLSGRNLCKINGRLVTVTELKKFMKDILDIHSQNENQNLLDISTHISTLDLFIGEDIKGLKNEYLKLFLEFNNTKLELNKNYGDDIERQRKLDLLKYQYNEIEEAQLQVGEEQALEEKRIVMQNCEKITENTKLVQYTIENNLLNDLDSMIKALDKISNFDTFYLGHLENIKGSYYEFEEILRDFSDYTNKEEYDSITHDDIQNRLDLIFNLKRKYGSNINEILAYKETLNNEINVIENLEEYIIKLKNNLDQLKDKMLCICKKMDSLRKECAEEFETKVNLELSSLEMKNAKFKIGVLFDSNESFNKNGLNKVEFLICTNVGDEYKPLAKIASGGEMSRIMLAIKTVIASIDNTSTVVFDEIDTGISGNAAKSVGEKIKRISKNTQVIAVTHQPILTAMADTNYKIEKNVEGERTYTSVTLLSEEELIKEIARISTGNVTDIAINHALELRKTSICA